MKEFLLTLEKNLPATDDLIAEAESHLGQPLPNEYIDFLKVTNGGEGFLGANSYVMFWKVEELASINRSYQTEEYAPGLLLFGSDGGGEAYGFDTRLRQGSIIQVPFIGMAWDDALLIAESFHSFLQRLHDAQ